MEQQQRERNHQAAADATGKVILVAEQRPHQEPEAEHQPEAEQQPVALQQPEAAAADEFIEDANDRQLQMINQEARREAAKADALEDLMKAIDDEMRDEDDTFITTED